MAAALLTLTTLSVLGLAGSLLIAPGLLQTLARATGVAAGAAIPGGFHVALAVFSTMLSLFAHSMMMFYLLGKGRAVREAIAEHALPDVYMPRVKTLRGPAFSRATYAMFLTMAAAIIGASVDVGVLPAWPHATLAAGAVALNLFALWTEVVALRGTSHIVDEVNARIGVNRGA